MPTEMKKLTFVTSLFLLTIFKITAAVGIFNPSVRINSTDYSSNSNLGSVAPGSLILEGGAASTFQNGGDDVCHVNLNYSMTGGPSGAVILNYISNGTNSGDKNFQTIGQTIDISTLPSGTYTLVANYTIFGRYGGVTCFGSINDFTTGTLATISITFSISPLAVTYASFDARPVDGKVSLHWKTLSEHNSDYFEVQCSADGDSYKTIGSIKAQGLSLHEKSYSFLHTSPYLGTSYYRIKEVDVDGKFQFSTIRSISIGANQIDFAPNPTNGVIYFSGMDDGSYNISVSDMAGKTIISVKQLSDSSLDISSLKTGIYLITIKNDYISVTKKMIKQ
jgi:hypothetical protein